MKLTRELADYSLNLILLMILEDTKEGTKRNMHSRRNKKSKPNLLINHREKKEISLEERVFRVVFQVQ